MSCTLCSQCLAWAWRFHYRGPRSPHCGKTKLGNVIVPGWRIVQFRIREDNQSHKFRAKTSSCSRRTKTELRNIKTSSIKQIRQRIKEKISRSIWFNSSIQKPIQFALLQFAVGLQSSIQKNCSWFKQKSANKQIYFSYKILAKPNKPTFANRRHVALIYTYRNHIYIYTIYTYINTIYIYIYKYIYTIDTYINTYIHL